MIIYIITESTLQHSSHSIHNFISQKHSATVHLAALTYTKKAGGFIYDPKKQLKNKLIPNKKQTQEKPISETTPAKH